MSEISWILLLNLSGVILIAAWIIVGIQFHQTSGEHVRVRKSLYALYFTLSMIVIFLVNWRSKYTGSQVLVESLTFAAIYLSVLLAGRILYHRSPFQILKVLIMLICLTGMVALIQVVINSRADHITENLYILLILHQITTAVYLILAGGILRKLFTPADWSGKRVPWKIILQCLCLLVFAILLIASQSYLVFFLKGGIMLLAIGWGAILLTGILTIDLYGIRERHALLHHELSVYKKQAELRFAYYQELEEKYDDARKLIHDIRNHLHAIEGLYAKGYTEAAGGYTEEIHGMLNRLAKKYYCDSRILNIILSDKIENAQRQGIKVTVRIGEVRLDWMNDVDVTTVFANLLDNAVTAAGKVPNKPWLSISVREIRDFIVIEIKNAARPKNSYEVKEKKHAGIGLKNVRYTVEKHNGTLEIEQDDAMFRVSVVIPLEVQ